MAPVPAPDRKNETKTRTTDAKGRVTLTREFASCLVDLEVVDEFEIRIRKVVAIPEREAWLWKNTEALGSVLIGLREARAGRFVEAPDVAGDVAKFDEEEP